MMRGVDNHLVRVLTTTVLAAKHWLIDTASTKARKAHDQRPGQAYSQMSEYADSQALQ